MHVDQTLGRADATALNESGNDGGLLVDLGSDGVGEREDDGMGVAKRELDVPSLELGPIADADDLQRDHNFRNPLATHGRPFPKPRC